MCAEWQERRRYAHQGKQLSARVRKGERERERDCCLVQGGISHATQVWLQLSSDSPWHQSDMRISWTDDAWRKACPCRAYIGMLAGKENHGCHSGHVLCHARYDAMCNARYIYLYWRLTRRRRGGLVSVPQSASTERRLIHLVAICPFRGPEETRDDERVFAAHFKDCTVLFKVWYAEGVRMGATEDQEEGGGEHGRRIACMLDWCVHVCDRAHYLMKTWYVFTISIATAARYLHIHYTTHTLGDHCFSDCPTFENWVHRLNKQLAQHEIRAIEKQSEYMCLIKIMRVRCHPILHSFARGCARNTDLGCSTQQVQNIWIIKPYFNDTDICLSFCSCKCHVGYILCGIYLRFCNALKPEFHGCDL